MDFTRDWSCPGARWAEVYWNPGDNECRVRYFGYRRDGSGPIPAVTTARKPLRVPVVDAPAEDASTIHDWAAERLAEHFTIEEAERDHQSGLVGAWALAEASNVSHDPST